MQQHERSTSRHGPHCSRDDQWLYWVGRHSLLARCYNTDRIRSLGWQRLPVAIPQCKYLDGAAETEKCLHLQIQLMNNLTDYSCRDAALRAERLSRIPSKSYGRNCIRGGNCDVGGHESRFRPEDHDEISIAAAAVCPVDANSGGGGWSQQALCQRRERDSRPELACSSSAIKAAVYL